MAVLALAQKAQLPLCPFPLKKEKKSVATRTPKTSICFTHHGKAIKTLSNRTTVWFLNVFVYFKEIMSLRFQNVPNEMSCSVVLCCFWNREAWIWVLCTFFSIIFAFVAKDGNEEMQTNSARRATEKTQRVKECVSASTPARGGCVDMC